MPRYLKQKRQLLDQLAEMDGPWRSQLDAIYPALGGLAFYDDMRNVLAHGTARIANVQGKRFYVFNSVVIERSAAADSVATMDEVTAEAFLDDVEACVKEIADALDTITGWSEVGLPEALIALPQSRT